MKTSTIVDTNILIDILAPSDAGMRDWSLTKLEHCAGVGPLVLSAVVWAELATPRSDEVDLARKLEWLQPKREDFPFQAGYPAGRAHQLYRQRGGRRERTLPDFLIGAHAVVAGHRLLTRDPALYRAYFPELDIVCPETHP